MQEEAGARSEATEGAIAGNENKIEGRARVEVLREISEKRTVCGRGKF